MLESKIFRCNLYKESLWEDRLILSLCNLSLGFSLFILLCKLHPTTLLLGIPLSSTRLSLECRSRMRLILQIFLLIRWLLRFMKLLERKIRYCTMDLIRLRACIRLLMKGRCTLLQRENLKKEILIKFNDD